MSRAEPAPRPAVDVAVLGGAVSVATVCVLPVFLVGGLAVQMKADLGFGASGLGIATATFFGTGVLTSALGGRLSEWLGPVRGMRLAAAGSVVALGGIAAGARSFPTLLGFLVVGGGANALAQPATNLFLARGVPAVRQGLAFGIKQSAIPASTMLAGLAVPALALTVGWRWAFAVGAVGAAVVAVRGPGRRGPEVAAHRARRGRDEDDAALRPLVVLAIGIGLGAAAAGTLGSFLVSSSVAAGVGEGAAGLLFALSSGIGLCTRVLVGVRADRRGGRHLPVVAGMLAVGSLTYLVLSTGAPLAHLLAGPVAFAAGWGWPGLFNFAIVRNNPGAPAAATGITQTGTYAGAVLGPLLFGLVVEQASYATAWRASAACAVLAAVTVVIGRRLLVADAAARAARRERPGGAEPVR